MLRVVKLILPYRILCLCLEYVSCERRDMEATFSVELGRENDMCMGSVGCIYGELCYGSSYTMHSIFTSSRIRIIQISKSNCVVRIWWPSSVVSKKRLTQPPHRQYSSSAISFFDNVYAFSHTLGEDTADIRIIRFFHIYLWGVETIYGNYAAQ